MEFNFFISLLQKMIPQSLFSIENDKENLETFFSKCLSAKIF